MHIARRLASLALSLALACTLLACATPPPAADCPTEPLDILLTNDDGYQSPGIRALLAALRSSGHRVTVAAPDRNFSGASASLTLAQVRAEPDPTEPDVYALTASPATSVIIGVGAFFPPDAPPDLVVSGINAGANVGRATVISGTVGATTAALRMFDEPIPAVAFSTNLPEGRDATKPANVAHFGHVAAFSARLVDRLNATRCHAPESRLLPPGIALNVNYPALPPDQVKGVAGARQGPESEFRLFFREAAPGVFAPDFELREVPHDVPDSDAALFDQGFVTVVPLDADLSTGSSAAEGAALRVLGLDP